MDTFRLMKVLRLLLIVAAVCALPACASWFGKGRIKSSAHMYEGDESPNIRMYDEGPGSPLHN